MTKTYIVVSEYAGYNIYLCCIIIHFVLNLATVHNDRPHFPSVFLKLVSICKSTNLQKFYWDGSMRVKIYTGWALKSGSEIAQGLEGLRSLASFKVFRGSLRSEMHYYGLEIFEWTNKSLLIYLKQHLWLIICVCTATWAQLYSVSSNGVPSDHYK